ncbi:hypothetical protein [Halalkalibacter alkalisediminis]|uniref:Uncharacterized protein n=1 Tax=Halalkalibacter alkalisediminis TaxID=935616 RepID=A0ABV6NH89_9BACI|nr:hypothetical protein [Halalkalibacter alkalisediminis]
MPWDGKIISGEFDKEVNEFIVQQVKSQTTKSILNKKQTDKLYRYLKSHENDKDGQVITLYDQMFLSLSQEELQSLIRDLEEIQYMYH